MWRVLTGEWRFGDHLVKNNMREPWMLDPTLVLKEAGWRDKLLFALKRPLLLPQEASNRRAAVIAALRDLQRVPCEQQAAAIRQARQLEATARTAVPRFHPYNLAFNMMANHPDAEQYELAPYAGRMADIEALRHVMLLTIDLRQRGITSAQIAQELAAHPVVNPVTGEAFVWNAELGAVSFTALARDQQHWYVLPY
jgi:hypothetical protein